MTERRLTGKQEEGEDKGEGEDPFDPSNFVKIAKHPGGRPTSYTPDMCHIAVECGEKGFSRAQIAAEIGISRNSMAEYESQHPEFLNATTRANELSLAWWEEAGRRGMFMKGFSAPAYSLQIRNRFRAEYVEASEQNVNMNAKIDASVSVDRPPQETRDQWIERKKREHGELQGSAVVPTARAAN